MENSSLVKAFVCLSIFSIFLLSLTDFASGISIISLRRLGIFPLTTLKIRVSFKFEVTKKIYEQYSVNFGKGQGRSDTVKIYWILLVSLSLHFAITKNIKYLNTILKVNDLICSLNISKTCKDLPTNYLALVLSFELANIKNLSKEIDEVCLDFK